MQLLPLKFPKKTSRKTLILLLQAFHSENIFPSHFLCLSRERDKQVHDFPTADHVCSKNICHHISHIPNKNHPSYPQSPQALKGTSLLHTSGFWSGWSMRECKASLIQANALQFFPRFCGDLQTTDTRRPLAKTLATSLHVILTWVAVGRCEAGRVMKRSREPIHSTTRIWVGSLSLTLLLVLSRSHPRHTPTNPGSH